MKCDYIVRYKKSGQIYAFKTKINSDMYKKADFLDLRTAVNKFTK